ncbi:MAG: S8 family serine peptidase, partial [Novosphingobium sp.]|uniref:S8 family serine peptidase n=1 Tax=Novosphingobium sp. TaxID=1874826 RepID=UPI003B9A0940
YPGVLAVTAVDGRNRALIEAGRALHLDYAAPGANLLAANAAGQWKPVRGTSFATPLVAARAARALASNGARWRVALDSEAVDLGRKGPDPVFGRGLICGSCRRTK